VSKEKRKFMFRSIPILFALLVLMSCQEEESGPECSVPAVVRDLTGFDGCGFVFELEDGTRLEPVIRYYYGFCGTPPHGIQEAPEDPLSNFEFVDGKKVRIEYEVSDDAMSICMVGPIVNITCITEVGFEEQEITP
jgi:hypothetical protein